MRLKAKKFKVYSLLAASKARCSSLTWARHPESAVSRYFSYLWSLAEQS